MRKAIFEVPSEVIGEFTEKLTDLELENSIVGKNDEEEIEIEVLYEKDESKQVDELEAFLEELKEDFENSDEDDEEDDEQ
jgi:predicted CopG family antitoxin